METIPVFSQIASNQDKARGHYLGDTVATMYISACDGFWANGKSAIDQLAESYKSLGEKEGRLRLSPAFSLESLKEALAN